MSTTGKKGNILSSMIEQRLHWYGPGTVMEEPASKPSLTLMNFIFFYETFYGV